MNKKYKIDHYQEELPICLVVPTHNNFQNGRYERFALSVVQQNYSNYHIVIVDDFSDDLTLLYTINLFDKLHFNRKRIHYIQNLY